MFSPVHLASAIAAALVLIVVIDRLRRGRLRERHALWWLLAGVIGLLLTIFPKLLEWFSSMIGIAVPINLAFFGSILVLFLVTMQQSSELTQTEERVRTLAEREAILSQRLSALEARLPPND